MVDLSQMARERYEVHGDEEIKRVNALQTARRRRMWMAQLTAFVDASTDAQVSALT